MFEKIYNFCFDNNLDIRYLEIMKELAYEQKLYIIIASTDYIYGTNYQFCHGYIGKDLNNLSNEKIIQVLGRVGRTKTTYNYSFRLRDKSLCKKIFFPNPLNKEFDKFQVLKNKDPLISDIINMKALVIQAFIWELIFEIKLIVLVKNIFISIL